MLILVEGPDGSGKTTLCTNLRKGLKRYSWFLRSNKPPETIISLTRTVEWIRRRPEGIPIVCDRYPLISEMVYGPVIRGKSSHGLSVSQVAQYLKDSPSPVVVIYCRPPLSVIERDLHQESQMHGVLSNIVPLVEQYDQVMISLGQSGLDIRKYDWTDGSHQSLIQQLNNLMEGKEDERQITRDLYSPTTPDGEIPSR